MSPIEWMEQHEYGFAALQQQERDAIQHFTMLWTLFEARLLKTNASSKAILALVSDWNAKGVLDPAVFEPSFLYFRERYFPNGNESPYFAGLELRPSDSPELVRSVLDGSNAAPSDKIAALLIIVYRLRNNLFHGLKWAYGIGGQRDNFEQASRALMAALPLSKYS